MKLFEFCEKNVANNVGYGHEPQVIPLTTFTFFENEYLFLSNNTAIGFQNVKFIANRITEIFVSFTDLKSRIHETESEMLHFFSLAQTHTP